MKRAVKAPLNWTLRFVLRRRAHVAVWALLGAILGVFAVFTTPDNRIAVGWHTVARLEGETYLRALLGFSIEVLLPFALLVLIAAVLFALVAGAIGLITALLPRRFATVVDGLAIAATVMAILQMLDISRVLRTLPAGTLLDLTSIWLALIALSGVLWNRLPGGMRHLSHVSRDIAAPLDEVRDRLIPQRNPTVALADFGIGGQDPALPGSWQPVATRRDGADSWRIDEPAGGAPWRRMRFRLTEASPGKTRIDIDLELNALSPMAWWDVVTRPYGEDYLDHLEARLTGCKDRSTYGFLAARHRAAAIKKARRATRNTPALQV